MAITYVRDIAPHSREASALRSRLLSRQMYLYRLHEHHGRSTFWRVAFPSLLLFWALVGYSISRLL